MFINKIGMEHLESGMNCQDYGFEGDRVSCVCDGCSEGKHSEVGAKLYSHLWGEREFGNAHCFQKMIDFFGNSAKVLKDYMSFTILQLIYGYEENVVQYCGDGYIILQDHDGNITFEELSDGEYPKYYIYNYIPLEDLITETFQRWCFLFTKDLFKRKIRQSRHSK